jgi:hypothetical protein
MGNNIKERARNKIWSKFVNTTNEIKRLERELASGGSGGITIEELQGVLENVRSDNLLYSYILGLIEKDI